MRSRVEARSFERLSNIFKRPTARGVVAEQFDSAIH
jgi:hypothetical protein